MTRRVHPAARIAGTLTGLGLAAAVGCAALLMPWPTIAGTGIGDDAAAPRETIHPTPSAVSLACDGPVVALGRDPSDPQSLSVASDLGIVALNAQGEEPDDEGRIFIDGVGEAVVIDQPPRGRESVAVSASGAIELGEPDLTGYAASACRPGAPESWLVGATVSTGTTDLISVSNPTEVAATVSIDVFGVEGHQSPPGGVFALPAGTSRVIPVASVAGTEETPVIRVVASGAPVRASLQSSRILTLDPAGLDVQPASLPARDLVIPRVTVTSSAAESADEPTELRLLSTEGTDTTAEVSVISERSGRERFQTSVDLTADEPLSLELADLPAGSYAVRVTADDPVVAAVRQAAGTDYAWFAPGDELGETSLVAIPDAPDGAMDLAFAALGDRSASVLVERIDEEESPETIEVEPSRSASIEVASGGTYRVIVEDGSVVGSVSHAEDDAIASFPVLPDPAAPDPVTVFP